MQKKIYKKKELFSTNLLITNGLYKKIELPLFTTYSFF